MFDQGDPLILESVCHHLDSLFRKSHCIVVDLKELRIVDIDYMMCVLIHRKKSNYVFLIIGSHSHRRVECVAKSLSGRSEVLDPKFWDKQRSVKLANV